MIATIRKINKSKGIILFLCTSIILFSCKESVTGVTTTSYSGEQLFDGIIFGLGPVAKELSGIGSLTKIEDFMNINDPLYKEFLATKDLIFKSIVEVDKDYFNNFKKGVFSGDHNTIQETLLNSSLKFKEAMVRISGYSDEQLTQLSSEMVVKYNILDSEGKYSVDGLKKSIKSIGKEASDIQSRDACWVPVAIALAIVIVVVIALAQVYAVYFQWAYAAQDYYAVPEAPELQRSAGSLYREQLVNHIYITFTPRFPN
ncbi:MAG: hypothetical protein HOP08_08105 [Cyclobacteriaceae bacterium]|nr:hypothetical protein [Cyclobacteriaceae bacterium]